MPAWPEFSWIMVGPTGFEEVDDLGRTAAAFCSFGTGEEDEEADEQEDILASQLTSSAEDELFTLRTGLCEAEDDEIADDGVAREPDEEVTDEVTDEAAGVVEDVDMPSRELGEDERSAGVVSSSLGADI